MKPELSDFDPEKSLAKKPRMPLDWEGAAGAVAVCGASGVVLATSERSLTRRGGSTGGGVTSASRVISVAGAPSRATLLDGGACGGALGGDSSGGDSNAERSL